jgi:hypothetical protein
MTICSKLLYLAMEKFRNKSIFPGLTKAFFKTLLNSPMSIAAKHKNLKHQSK